MPGFMEKVNEGITSDFGVDLKLQATRVITLPVHYESERAVVYSMTVRYAVAEPGGGRSIHEGVTTVASVYVRGKILFLYTFAGKNGLEWSRVESRKLGDAVIAANPSDADVAALESADRGSGGFDWGQVLKVTFIGGIAGAVSYFLRKKRVES